MRRKPNRTQTPSGLPARASDECTFCKIARGDFDSVRVFEDEDTLALLDYRPLFPGHCLLITKRHLRTIADLPPALLDSVFTNARLLSIAVQDAMNAEGTFIAVNNVISQSVPHFHVHIVPRRKGDGLHGFMWPRHKYANASEARVVGKKIRDELAKLQLSKT